MRRFAFAFLSFVVVAYAAGVTYVVVRKPLFADHLRWALIVPFWELAWPMFDEEGTYAIVDDDSNFVAVALCRRNIRDVGFFPGRAADGAILFPRTANPIPITRGRTDTLVVYSAGIERTFPLAKGEGRQVVRRYHDYGVPMTDQRAFDSVAASLSPADAAELRALQAKCQSEK